MKKKLTKTILKRIIKEEKAKLLKEGHFSENYVSDILHWVEHEVDKTGVEAVLWALGMMNDDKSLLKELRKFRSEYDKDMRSSL